MAKKYTAEEMRSAAVGFSGLPDDCLATVGPAVRQEDYPATIFRSNDIAAMLRQAADEIEREKKYEYAVEYCEFHEKWEVYKNGLTLVEAQELSSESWSNPHRIVRRAVGEWEEVE